jgi:hypothetical protein
MATVTCNCFKGRANEGIQAKMSEPNRPNHTKKPMTIAYYRDHIHSDPWGLESKTREADTNAKVITKKKA